MAVFKRGKFYWYEFIFDGKRIRKSTKQGDKETAKKLMSAERSRLARIDAGLESPDLKAQAKSATVGDLLDGLKQFYQSEDKASAQNLSTIEQARKVFGKIKAADLTQEHIESYIRERLKKGRKKATVNRVTELVRRAYKVGEVTPPKIRHLSEKDNVRKGFFTVQEFESVVKKLPEDLRDFSRFGFITGWRKGEIASLRWEDVQEGVIRLRGEHSKNREARQIVIEGELAELIERRRAAQGVSTGRTITMCELIFHRDGQPVREFRTSWANACVAAGLGKMVGNKYRGRIFHDLRRSGVRNLVRSGVPQSVAMQISGHKTASMFRRYDISNEDDLRQAMLNLKKYHEAERKKVAAMEAGR